MKTIKYSLFTLLLITYVIGFGQEISNVSKKLPSAQPFRFYTSYEDFLSNNPIEGYEIFRKQRGKAISLLDYDHLWVKNNGVEKHIKPKEYPALLFTDENGLLNRHYDGSSYLIFIKGKYCYYLWPYSQPVRSDGNGEFVILGQRGSGHGSNYQNSSFPSMHWSIGIDGNIKEIKDKDFVAELGKFKLDKKYQSKKPKRELIMGAVDYGAKKHTVYVEFIELLNQQ